MKKLLYILPVAALALAGCTTENVVNYYEDRAPQLEVSSAFVVFGTDGGSKTVLVTTDAAWQWSCSDTWFDVTEGEGSLTISADGNSTPANRHGTITVTAGDNGELSQTVSVAQTAVTGEDLSEGGTANSYIARTGSTYRFDATVKGNGLNAGVGGIAAYVDKYGVDIDPDEIVYAELLWEASFDADKTSSYNIIDGEPIYSNGYVWFTTGSFEGNAAIAVKNAVGDILWSWHIWVTDAEIGETVGKGYHWMDRNLGALNNEPCDINNRGLLYQWGRKDPFLPSAAAYDAAEPDVTNNTVGDGSGAWDLTGVQAKISTQAPGNIVLSIHNPMTLLRSNGSIWTWYMTNESDDNYASYLWGNSEDLSTYVKSIFDPCPPGYNVPVDNPWIDENDSSVDNWTAGDDYGRYWTGGGSAFYPTAGAINGTAGTVGYSNTYGYYWTSGMQESTEPCYYTMMIMFTTTRVLSYSSSYPVHAMSVRCMRVD